MHMQIVLALKCQIPADATTEKPVPASKKCTTESKSPCVNKPENTPTPSLDIGTDGYGVLVHKHGIHSSPTAVLTQSTDANASDTNANAVDVENGTFNNVMEYSPHYGNVHPPAAPASTDVNHENDVGDFDKNDHHVAVESPDSAKYIQFMEAAPVNVAARDEVEDNSLVMPGITHVVDSAHPLDPDATTADKSNDFTNGLPRTEETAVGNATESQKREIVGPDNVVNLSEVANMLDTDSSTSEEVECTALVKVDGYLVRKDLEATAQFILTKYGDIVVGTSHSLSFRSWIFANICETYRNLEKSTFAKLSLPKLKQMQNDVGVAARENFDVRWLVNMLEEICDAKESLQQFSCLKDEMMLSDRVISELERELEMQKAILRKTHQKVEDIEEKLKSEKAKVEAREMVKMEVNKKVQKFYKKTSLVDI